MRSASWGGCVTESAAVNREVCLSQLAQINDEIGLVRRSQTGHVVVSGATVAPTTATNILNLDMALLANLWRKVSEQTLGPPPFRLSRLSP